MTESGLKMGRFAQTQVSKYTSAKIYHTGLEFQVCFKNLNLITQFQDDNFKIIKISPFLTLINSSWTAELCRTITKHNLGQVSSPKKILEFFDLEKTMNGTDTTIL